MKKRNNNRYLYVLVFLVYLGVLFYFLFFAEMFGRAAIHEEYSYNLVPFKEITRFIKYRDILGSAAVWLNLVGNVVAFVPFGLFLPVLIKRDAGYLQVAFFTMLLSLIIECIQLVSKVGSFDVDDIILNTLGGIIGGVLCYLYRKYKK